MKALLFYPLYIFLWLITWLPLGVLYGLSDFLFFLTYRVASYRKKTIIENLRNSFPDMPEEEINYTARKFYRQLTDYFIEWIYRIHMGDRELARRMKYTNPELLENTYSKGKSIMLMLSHYGNWEWPTRITLLSEHKVLAVYKPLQNKYFDRLFLNLRGRFGAVGVPIESTLRTIITNHKQGIPVLVYNLADQRPQYASLQHWTTFMEQDTPVITGSEKIAQKFDMACIFLAITRVKRGYYEAEFKILTEDPSSLKEYELTRMYLDELEALIRKQPELYLWSHKRWKYNRTDTKKEIIEI